MKPELIDRLRQRATVPFEVDRDALLSDRLVQHDNAAELSVRVLSGIGGFFASLVFLLALWLTELINVPVISASLGIALIVVTILLGRNKREAFLASITICGYLVGVCLTMVGLPPDVSDAQLVIPVAVIAAATLVFTRNYFLVVLAVASLPACLLYLQLTLHSVTYAALAVTLTAASLVAVSFLEYRFIADRRFPAVRAGLALGMLMTLLWYRWGQWMADEPYERYGVLPISLLLYALTAFTLWRCLPPRWGVLAGIVLLPFTLLPLLLGSFLLLLVSFRSQHFAGVGLGAVGLLYFTAQYYYDLRWNLLDKSLVLMASGALLLGLYYYLQRRIPADVPA